MAEARLLTNPSEFLTSRRTSVVLLSVLLYFFFFSSPGLSASFGGSRLFSGSVDPAADCTLGPAELSKPESVAAEKKLKGSFRLTRFNCSAAPRMGLKVWLRFENGVEHSTLWNRLHVDCLGKPINDSEFSLPVFGAGHGLDINDTRGSSRNVTGFGVAGSDLNAQGNDLAVVSLACLPLFSVEPSLLTFMDGFFLKNKFRGTNRDNDFELNSFDFFTFVFEPILITCGCRSGEQDSLNICI